MEDRSSRSAAQTAADLARAARSAARIAKAAAVAGPYGAAAEAVKEALPFLLKLVVGVIAAIFILILVVFTAIPNMFFGYENTQTVPVVEMTTLAMNLGGTYINLEDFEAAQADAVVTRLVQEYAEAGVTVDKIEVEHSFTQDDLIWVIAINSAAYQQDLNAMTPEDIQAFVLTHISYTFTLLDGEQTVLKVSFQKLDPETLMEEMGFDSEGKTWAGALRETLLESDALSKYASYFEPYRPNYGGDTSGPSDAQHGSSFSNDIDISHFVSPGAKNNLDLAAYAVQAWENNWGYVWGTYGNVLTETLLDYKIEQYPDGVGDYEDFIWANWLNRRTTDCVGLIKGYGWLDADTLQIKYGTNGMPDYGANAMHQAAVNVGTEGVDYGSMSTMPEIPGLALWKNGHIGVYIGGGYAVEASSTKTGVVKTKVEGRGWSGWCKIPYIAYLKE